jgi:hypothetical protein
MDSAKGARFWRFHDGEFMMRYDFIWVYDMYRFGDSLYG